MTRMTRTILTLLAAFAVVASLGGCSGAKKDAADAAASKTESSTVDVEGRYPVTIVDDAGRKVTVKAEPKRIVSLAPANTETLFALGIGDRVVGVTSYDDYPAEVADIAKVGDFQGPNLEAVAAANPDLVLVTTGVQADMIAQLEKLGATVVAIDPQTMAGVFNDIRKVGSITGTPAKAEQLIATMLYDLSEVKRAVAEEDPVTAFLEVGQNPLFTAGSATLIGEMIELAGGKNVVADEGYVPYSTEQLVKADPDVYLATKGSSNDPASVEKRAGYKGLSAVKNGRIVILDDNLVSRPGPRIIEGLKQIAVGLHPDAFAE